LIDGSVATFVWYGDDPPVLRGDFNDWDLDTGLAWHRLESRAVDEATVAVWYATLELPQDAYMEYCLGPDEDRQPDPFNKRRTPNGMGQTNHYFYMPEAKPTPLALRRRGIAAGVVTRHEVETDGILVGGRRRVYLYQPPVTQPCPLLVVYDGNDYRRRARLATLMDNLIAQRRIQPLALAFVANGGSRARFAEYTCSESALVFLHQKVLPLASAQLNLVDVAQRPGAYGVLGASLGGLMALFTGLRLPQIFGRVLSQSGAFHLDDHDTVTVELVRHGPRRNLRIWMDVGRYEWLLESNRRMVQLLRERGYQVGYREYNGGHNYPSWRDDVWRGLEAVFPRSGP
jgi:enterochelin esterase family protein